MKAVSALKPVQPPAPEQVAEEKSPRLTRREAEVARAIGQGMSTAEIAAKFCKSPKTVEAQRSSLYARLGVRSALKVCRWSIKTGLADATDAQLEDGWPITKLVD